MNLSCNIVRDLVAVCTDGAASEDTERAVRAHLHVCPACARYYHDYARIARTDRRYRARRTATASSPKSCAAAGIRNAPPFFF